MQKTMQKVLIILLIFTLTFAYPALVTQTFAASIFDGLAKGDTGSSKVLFGAGFDSNVDYDKGAETSFDVNNKDAVIVLKLNVKDEGYLKNGKIQLVGSEDGGDPNFVLKTNTRDLSEETEYVEGIENNTISLKQIDCGSEVSISVPIEYSQEDMVSLSKIANKNYASFTGTYVDIKGNEKSLSKMTELDIKWTDSRTPEASIEVVKYIPYNTGIILQTKIDVDNSTEANAVPLEKSVVDLDIPEINGKQPSEVSVVATELNGTNGSADEKVKFNKDNYKVENGKLHIEVNNEEQSYKPEKTVINDLVDASEEVAEEQRVYNGSGKDSYIVTYTYSDAKVDEERKGNTIVTGRGAAVLVTAEMFGKIGRGVVHLVSKAMNKIKEIRKRNLEKKQERMEATSEKGVQTQTTGNPTKGAPPTQGGKPSRRPDDGRDPR